MLKERCKKPLVVAVATGRGRDVIDVRQLRAAVRELTVVKDVRGLIVEQREKHQGLAK